jgi:hypothetical protein
MKLTPRNTHRDIAYFYVGLIISFSISGIFLNHRQSWSPRRYTHDVKGIVIPAPTNKEAINETFISEFSKDNNITDDVRRFSVEGNTLKISYVSHDVQLDIFTGKGKIETYRTIPLLGHMTQLHMDTSKWWIYYSDVFGVAMLVIAITGMFIERGKNSFKARGWKLAVLGIIFPLIFLFLIS